MSYCGGALPLSSFPRIRAGPFAVRDSEIRAMALFLLKRRPRDAMSAALNRSSELTARGDLRAATMWSRIVLELAKLEVHPPPR
jgi:hypothetical protein